MALLDSDGSAIRLVVQRSENRIHCLLDFSQEPPENMRAPLREVYDPGCEAEGMEADAKCVHRRLQQLLGDASEQELEALIRGDERPVAVDEECGARLETGQQKVGGPAEPAERGIIERPLMVLRRIARCEEEPVALA